jgi:hypothetical protein
MTKAGLLGAFEIDVYEGPDEYLFGEEKGLLEVLECNLPMPRILPPFPRGLVPDRGIAEPDAGEQCGDPRERAAHRALRRRVVSETGD